MVCPPMCVVPTLHCMTGASFSKKFARPLSHAALLRATIVVLMKALAARMPLPVSALALSMCALLVIVTLVASLLRVGRL